MIKTVTFQINGIDFIRTFSDAGMKIHGGSPVDDYDVAEDPAEFNRTYTETDIPIDSDSTAEDIVNILTGETP